MLIVVSSFLFSWVIVPIFLVTIVGALRKLYADNKATDLLAGFQLSSNNKHETTLATTASSSEDEYYNSNDMQQQQQQKYDDHRESTSLGIAGRRKIIGNGMKL